MRNIGHFKVPVLFIVFNRFDETKEVFDAIRKVKPAILYISSDAPRIDVPSDREKVDNVRKIFENIDWDCEIHKNYHNSNQGCRLGPEKAINWFFENVPEGIILEDDCLPHMDFFKFCEWGLKTFRNDKQVWHINGNNFSAPKKLYFDKFYSFTSIPQVWGWATWADRWRFYQGNPFYLHREISQYAIHLNWGISNMAKLIKLSHLDKLMNGLDAWDYQWQITVLNNKGLVLSCSSNLISNLGDGPDATHTHKDIRIRLRTECVDISNSVNKLYLTSNKNLTNWYESLMGMRSIRTFLKTKILFAYKGFNDTVKKILSRLLFRYNDCPIVIASTGRSGSTLLYESIIESYIVYRYPFLSKVNILKNIFKKAAGGFLDRLADIRNMPQPVLKTHSLYDSLYAKTAKYIFVYGDPLDSARSVVRVVKEKGTIWLDEHLYHLESCGYLDDIYENDILNYENQIMSWDAKSSINILSIPYESIWDKSRVISDFIGFDLFLPAKKSRKANDFAVCYNELMFGDLKKLYLSKSSSDLYGRPIDQ